MRKEMTQIIKIRNESGHNKHKEIQRIITEHFQNLYSNKLKNLEEMDKFLDTNDHIKLNQEDIHHQNISITCNEIEVAIWNLPLPSPKKVQDLMDSPLNSTRPPKKN
jgi:hypothetical protein